MRLPNVTLVPTEPDAEEREKVRVELRAVISELERLLGEGGLGPMSAASIRGARRKGATSRPMRSTRGRSCSRRRSGSPTQSGWRRSSAGRARTSCLSRETIRWLLEQHRAASGALVAFGVPDDGTPLPQRIQLLNEDANGRRRNEVLAAIDAKTGTFARHLLGLVRADVERVFGGE